jgi:hypothetical protein
VKLKQQLNINKMKLIKLTVIGILFLLAGVAQAQLSVQLNVGTPPQWGPAGYSDARYYYLPDVEAYYDVPSSQFIYHNGASWVRRPALPSRYRNYNLYSGYKVVMADYNGNAPYAHFKNHKKKYAKGYQGQPQKNYGEQPEKANGEKSYNKGKGNGKGNGKKK